MTKPRLPAGSRCLFSSEEKGWAPLMSVICCQQRQTAQRSAPSPIHHALAAREPKLAPSVRRRPLSPARPCWTQSSSRYSLWSYLTWGGYLMKSSRLIEAPFISNRLCWDQIQQKRRGSDRGGCRVDSFGGEGLLETRPWFVTRMRLIQMVWAPGCRRWRSIRSDWSFVTKMILWRSPMLQMARWIWTGILILISLFSVPLICQLMELVSAFDLSSDFWFLILLQV